MQKLNEIANHTNSTVMMKRYAKTLLLLAMACQAHAQKADHLIFNEVMQSNIDYLLVEKDFPDSWVELYNPTDAPINLSGYSIGEHADQHNAYRFPTNAGKVPAQGHLVVYCDKEGKGLHTSFRIDSGKASVYLFDNSGTAIDSLILPKMPAPNIAYGRVTDGAEEWHYEVTPSAGEANASVGSDLLLPDPAFSTPGGLCTEPFQLTLSIPEGIDLPEDTKLYYTTNGAEPTRESTCVEGSLTLDITKTTVIRAKLLSDNALSTMSAVQSYIFHPRQTRLPIVSIVTNDAYLKSSEMGIISATVNEGMPNYMQKWRRPINIEYYDLKNDGKQSFNQLGETAVSGVSTREQPQKSLKVYANKRFGKKTFKGDFWDDKPEVEKVKSFVLRSGGNNSFTTRINDALIQKIFGTHVDNMDWQAYQPVIVYINGSYRGEYGMRERSNEDFVEANYGLEDVEMADEESYQTPAKGSLFADFYKAYHSSSTTFADLEGMMDMDNFSKTLMAECYAMNTDFPTNNVSIWRSLPAAEEAEGEDTDKGEGASNLGSRWRWVLKDLDRAGMNIVIYPDNFDMMEYLFNPDDLKYSGMHHFDLYKKMSGLKDFQDNFTNHFMVYLGDFLQPEVVCALADSMSNEIYDELKYTFTAYNCTKEWSKYKQNMNSLKQFFTGRPDYLYKQMATYFNLGLPMPLSVSNAEGTVSLNGIRLTQHDFLGQCFSGNLVTLDSGNENLGWTMTVTEGDNAPIEHIFNSSKVEFLPSEYAASPSATIALTTYDMELVGGQENDAIATLPSTSSRSAIYSLSGVKRTHLQHGLNLVQKGGKVEKIIIK